MDSQDKEFQTAKLTTPPLNEIIADSSIPVQYANGFVVGRSPGDIIIIPLTNGVPQTILNISFLAAKQLADFLQKTIDEIEQAVGTIKPMG